MSGELFCPECGAPAPFRGTAVSLVCEYCSSTIVRTGADLQLIGKVSAIVDTGSPILLQASGRFKGTPFRVAGRLQVEYARGTWNEWFLEMSDGTVAWLSDAQGRYAIMQPSDNSELRDMGLSFNKLPPIGTAMHLQGRPLVYTDGRGAHYKGAEGVLPYPATAGDVFYSADLRGYKGEFATLDWGKEPSSGAPELYYGQSVKLGELGLDPIRSFEGWRR